MPSPISSLYEPLISRDLAAVPEAVALFRNEQSSEDLSIAIARFAYLAFAPSEHGRSAMRAVLSAREIAPIAGDRYDAWLTECALYSAESRLPWSEPPIAEKPSFTEEDRSNDAFLAAVASLDRQAGERWLAANLDDQQLARHYFAATSSNLAEFGRDLVGAVSAWRLALLLPDHERYAVLRAAVWDCVTPHEPEEFPPGAAKRSEILVRELLTRLIAGRGAVETFRPLLLLDAAQSVTEFTGDEEVEQRVNFVLGLSNGEVTSEDPVRTETPAAFEPYRLARDYGELLEAAALAARLSQHFPQLDTGPLVAAAADNLMNAASFEEWSFA